MGHQTNVTTLCRSFAGQTFLCSRRISSASLKGTIAPCSSTQWASFHRCSATPWHQDGSSAEDIPLATVWITLDDITPPFSGGLVVLPGQHKHNLLPSEASDHFQFDRILPVAYIAQQSPFRYPLRAGHAAIHHQWLPHASEPNLTLNYRRVIVLRYISTSVLMAEGVPLWSIRNDGELARECAIEEDGEAELYPDFRQEDVFIEGRNIILRGAH
ncbi:hypothetical protein AC1031_012723 [Aphanomyces cochlioides]|nr:hypothetical protein AC1031_012723 [Aphanomyces cochlioides]